MLDLCAPRQPAVVHLARQVRAAARRGRTDYYTFNKHNIQHKFCKHCGVQSFAFGTDPKGNEMAAINVRCLENFEFENLPVKHFNGKAL